jgi:hypothetical protein
MELKVNFGDELSSAKVNLPKVVPVTRDFNNSKLIGEAEVRQEGDKVIAKINIINEKEFEAIKDMLGCGVSGVVTEREGNLITEFDLKSISLKYLNTDN